MVRFTLLYTICIYLLALCPSQSFAHSIPDIPIRGHFQTGGETEIIIEVNPRSWEQSPQSAQSLENKDFQKFDEKQRSELLQKTKDFVAKYLEFRLEPIGRIQPDFTYDFIAETGKPLHEMTDAVIARGKWKTNLPAGITAWQVRSLPGHKMSVVYINKINDKPHPRESVLFPGETSYALDLSALTSSQPAAPDPRSISAEHDESGAWLTFLSRVREGFGHILPEGLDHILFVLGLFLLARTWKPILIQVTTFTVAHSITLALATLEYVSAPAKIVEPIIAASIAVIALENIFRPTYGKIRLALVFFFGLIHGLGFAQRLIDERIPEASILTSLLGFNIGVELGQLAVIGIALSATFWIKDEKKYRLWIVVPVSSMIAIAGLFWAVERLGLINI